MFSLVLRVALCGHFHCLNFRQSCQWLSLVAACKSERLCSVVCMDFGGYWSSSNSTKGSSTKRTNQAESQRSRSGPVNRTGCCWHTAGQSSVAGNYNRSVGAVDAAHLRVDGNAVFDFGSRTLWGLGKRCFPIGCVGSGHLDVRVATWTERGSFAGVATRRRYCKWKMQNLEWN
jgi:hypothetical protein